MPQPTVEQVKEARGQDLVDLYNQITGESVKKFSSREVGLKRTLRALAEKSGGVAVKDPPRARSKTVDLPAGDITPPRAGSKREKVVRMLESGTTADKIIDAMGWKKGVGRVRVRECLGMLSRLHGYGIVEKDGVLKIR